MIAFIKINGEIVNLSHIVVAGRSPLDDTVFIRRTDLRAPVILDGDEAERVWAELEAHMPWEPPTGNL